MTAKTKAVALQKYDLASPDKMTALATVLKKHVVGHNLYTNIKGKNYAHVEGWQFAGGMMGLYPIIAWSKNLSATGEIKWFVKAEIVNVQTGVVVGRGYALCSSKEGKKKDFDEYAILSMAQTRAIGKAYRNLIGWVMKLAGYESTPKEEMTKMGDEEKTSSAATAPTPVITVVEDTEVALECHESGCPLTRAEYNYSKKMYGKPLCREHQKGVRRVSAKAQK